MRQQSSHVTAADLLTGALSLLLLLSPVNERTAMIVHALYSTAARATAPVRPWHLSRRLSLQSFLLSMAQRADGFLITAPQ